LPVAFFREKVVMAAYINMAVLFFEVCFCKCYQSFLVADITAHSRFPSPNYFSIDYIHPTANCKMSNKSPIFLFFRLFFAILHNSIDEKYPSISRPHNTPTPQPRQSYLGRRFTPDYRASKILLCLFAAKPVRLWRDLAFWRVSKRSCVLTTDLTLYQPASYLRNRRSKLILD